ncbi:MAG: 23S rRNA (adenine(2030)-N(6))-methyltransferase RlmJ [Janthinobacterium lividum]
MLSYRHGFHAGNHADVLKHVVVLHLLRYMTRKDKAFWYVDTHAGAGAYSLIEGYAVQKAEFRTGIERLYRAPGLPPLLADYVAAVRAFNDGGELRNYPGSPSLAWRTLRDQDRLRLFEMHSTEIEVLRRNFEGAGQKLVLFDGDGFDGLRSVLPPASRRALTLIDPSYEDKRDYHRTVAALEDALQRFAGGTYVIWYPQVRRAEAERLPKQLKRLGGQSWLNVTLTISAPPVGGFGLYGSGLFVVNPSYLLAPALATAMPVLKELLGQDASASFTLEHFDAGHKPRPKAADEDGDRRFR